MKIFSGNKKGIELSVNFLVVIILSIVMLGMGVMMIRNFYSQSIETHQRISEKEEAQILSMLNRGEKVAMPVNFKKVQRGEIEPYGIGIFNVLEERKKFEIKIEEEDIRAFDLNDEPIAFPQEFVNIVIEETEPILEPNEFNTFNLFAKVSKDAVRGNYIYTVSIIKKPVNPDDTEEPALYGSRVRFTVVVP